MMKQYLNQYQQKKLSKQQLIPVIVDLLHSAFPDSEQAAVKDKLLGLFRDIMGSKWHSFINEAIQIRSCK
jgi:hypothetical protein